MSWLFDIQIFAFLVVVGATLILIYEKRSSFKQSIVFYSIFFCLLFSWSVIFYGSFIEPKLLFVRYQDISITDEPTTKLKAAVVSDIHIGPYKNIRWVEQVVERVNEEEPEIIFLLGDYVLEAHNLNHLDVLKDLQAKYGVYAIIGNHDYKDGDVEEIIFLFESLNITVLQNESMVISLEDNSFVLAGVDDLFFEGDINKTFEGIDGDQEVILLSHNPDAILETDSSKTDLILAGHTHGGQIRLPFIGPIPELPDELGRDYDKGLFQKNDQWLYITGGVGESGPRARLFMPPGFSILNIQF